MSSRRHIGGRSQCLVRICDLLLAHHWQLHLRVILYPRSGSRTTPHEDNSPPDKNKAQPLPTRTTIPTDYSPPGQLPTRTTTTNKTTHQDQNLYGGELSSWVDCRDTSPSVRAMRLWPHVHKVYTILWIERDLYLLSNPVSPKCGRNEIMTSYA